VNERGGRSTLNVSVIGGAILLANGVHSSSETSRTHILFTVDHGLDGQCYRWQCVPVRLRAQLWWQSADFQRRKRQQNQYRLWQKRDHLPTRPSRRQTAQHTGRICSTKACQHVQTGTAITAQNDVCNPGVFLAL